ncbi:MAG: hypothetical protein ACXVHK_30600 [Solirubrobacteraceae bacterium]
MAKIVGVFGGGPVECAAACQSVGFSVSVSTIRRWVSRERIPMDGWLMVSWTYDLLQGRQLQVHHFIKGKS